MRMIEGGSASLSGVGKGGSAPLTGTLDGSQRLLVAGAPHCRILFSQTDCLHLAPLDDQGYPFSRDHGFGEPHEAWPVAASRLRAIRRTAFVSKSNDARRPKGFRYDQARPIGARDPIAPFSLPAEARGTEERSQGSLPDQGPETIRRGAIPFPEANANLTDYPRLLIAHPSGQLAMSI